VLFVYFVVRTMGRGKDANHKSMFHREEPKIINLHPRQPPALVPQNDMGEDS
jgi:hypothetical protein